MSIQELITQLQDQAAALPNGYQSQVVAWVRVPNAGESAVLQISDIQQGYRKECGGSIATICLDQRA